jgi:hypothetical protein
MVMALAGCTAQRASTGQGAAGYPNADAKQGAPQAAPVQPNGKAQAPAVTVGAAGFQERKLVRTAKVEMTSTDVTAAVDRARQIAIGVGGYTGAESTGQGSATLTLAVPSDKLDVVIGQVVTVGTVTGREQNAQDVTDQTADIEARLTTQRASVERMRALLAKANSVSEVAYVEGELTTRESELESLERRRDALAGSVAMSTLTLSVHTAVPAPAQYKGGGGFLGGLAGGWDAFLVFGGGAVAVLGTVTPFLLMFGVPVAIALWWLRRRRFARQS